MEFNGGIQQPVSPFSFDRQVDAQICTQKQIGLTGFDGNANRSMSAVQIPCSRQDIMFGDDTSGTQRPLLAFNRQDAVHQHQGFIR